jgi:ATP/ADP translocase
MADSSSSSGGVGFFGLLTIVFVTLKLIGKIDWSWWLVLSPSLLIVAIVLFFVLVALAVEASK